MLKYPLITTLFLGIFCFSQTKTYSIKNLDINTDYAHFGLMPYGKNKILFTSYNVDKKGRVKHFDGIPALVVFEGDLSPDGKIKNIKPIQIDIKQGITAVTSAAISSDGKYIYLTTTYTRKSRPDKTANLDNFHIRLGEFKEGLGWTNFKVLPFCENQFSYAHPALSPDGKTLYFIANIQGEKEATKGGSDIFRVDILEDNTYGSPKNLGKKVNSNGSEMFPFMSQDNVLYFASDRVNGLGGFDIYMSKMNVDGTFNEAEKLPKPINSEENDFCFVINASNKAGYFASKRKGGKGADDIYYFSVNK